MSPVVQKAPGTPVWVVGRGWVAPEEAAEAVEESSEESDDDGDDDDAVEWGAEKKKKGSSDLLDSLATAGSCAKINANHHEGGAVGDARRHERKKSKPRCSVS